MAILYRMYVDTTPSERFFLENSWVHVSIIPYRMGVVGNVSIPMKVNNEKTLVRPHPHFIWGQNRCWVMMTAPGMGCLSMGLKGIVASSGGDSQLRSWVPNNGNMEPPGFLPTLTHVALSSQYLLASRVR
jgi:hypothetical protein